MFDWAKEIFGDTYTEELDKKLAEAIGKGFVARADFNAANEAKKEAEKSNKTLKGQLEDRDKQLEELKKVDAEGLQAKIAELQASNTEAKKAHDVELAAARKQFAIDTRLLSEGAVNVQAVRSLYDMEKISLDGENLIGFEEQHKTVKESNPWAFGAKPKAKGSDDHAGGGDEGTLTIDEEIAAGLGFRNKN